MQIKIINKIEDFLLIKDAWNELYSQGNYSTFQQFEINYFSWMHEFITNEKNQLAITIVKKDTGILAIFPFYIDPNKQLRFINDQHFDFCDFISQESINFSEVYNHLKQEIDFKSMRLINVREEADIYSAVKGIDIKHKVCLFLSEYSILNLDLGTFPYNASHYLSKHKNRINKIFKKYADKECVIKSKEHHSFPKKEIVLLSQKMIRLGIRKDNFLTNERLSLIESLYNSGTIILNIMKSKNEINCINILFKKSSNEFVFWIDLFDDLKMINISSYINFLKEISLEQSVSINFGRGRYAFKESNFAPEFYKLYQILIFSSKLEKLWFLIINNLRRSLILVYKKIKK